MTRNPATQNPVTQAPSSQNASPIQIQAGPSAYRKIMDEGLTPDQITAIFGASGSAKWLAIAGLDRAIFSRWLPTRQNPTPITLFGTSIGAFKLAAAAQKNPEKALDRLAKTYTSQAYRGAITPAEISRETQTLITDLLGTRHKGAQEILTNKRYHFACGAVRCHGALNATQTPLQKRAMVKGFFKTLTNGHNGDYERAVFADPRIGDDYFIAQDAYPIRRINLTADMLAQALTASGSIPVYMNGVQFADDPNHYYRDGGLLDYHPVPQRLMAPRDGLILYPHFYPHIAERWFDKFLPWRKCDAASLDNVVLISPSRAFVKALPQGRIPDRQDFVRYAQNEEERIRQWEIAVERSHELGELFISLCQSGDIAHVLQPIK